MFRQSINAAQAEEKFTVIQKDNSIYYELNDPKELKAIEVSDDLYRAKFYFTEVKGEPEKDKYEFTKERNRIRGVVSSAVYPSLPEIGHVSTNGQCVEIYGMQDYASMHKFNREHIKETVDISEQLHPLEWILTKVRNSGILPNDLYEKIRIDVRHRAAQLQEIAEANINSYEAMGLLSENVDSLSQFLTIRTGAAIPPFTPFTSGVIDWSRESENKDKSELVRPSKVYLIKGGNKESRREKAYDLARRDVFTMFAVYHNKDKSEYAVVFSCEHDAFNLMNFDLAKELAGQQQLSDDFSTSTFGREARFGVISLNAAMENNQSENEKFSLQKNNYGKLFQPAPPNPVQQVYEKPENKTETVLRK